MDVEYWDVTELLAEPRRRSSDPFPYLRIPASWRQLDAWIQANDQSRTMYVVLITYGGDTARLYRLLSRRGCRLAYIDWGYAPIRGGTHRFRRLLQNPLVLARSFVRRVLGALYRRSGLIKPFDVVFHAGAVAAANYPNASKHVPINLADYDNYLAAQAGNERWSSRRHAVFLDTNLPYQFDIRRDGLANPNPETYYPALWRFFALVEERYDVDVVIAAHPTATVGPDADSDYNPSTFGGRRIVQGRTAELVKDAAFVLGHNSTSFSYALLDYKPILFIYTAEMLELYRWTRIPEIVQLSEFLDAPVVNVDTVACVRDVPELRVNRARYDAYKYRYLTSPESELVPSAAIFTDELARELGMA